MNHICYDEYEVDSRYLEAGVTVQFGGVVFLDAIDLVFDLFVGCWPLHAQNTMNGRAARMNRVWLFWACVLWVPSLLQFGSHPWVAGWEGRARPRRR